MAKHYIRQNEQGIVVYGFTNEFEQPIPGDLQLSGDSGRHFHIALKTNVNGRGDQFIYKLVNGQMVERTQAELDAEWAARPAPAKTAEQKIVDKLTTDNEQLNLQVIDLFEQLIIKGVL